LVYFENLKFSEFKNGLIFKIWSYKWQNIGFWKFAFHSKTSHLTWRCLHLYGKSGTLNAEWNLTLNEKMKWNLTLNELLITPATNKLERQLDTELALFLIFF
jgi:hypothetical protein